MYLLDTNIISEPMKEVGNSYVCDKIIALQSQSMISAISYHEILNGVLRMADGKRKNKYMNYFNNVVCCKYAILPYSVEVARIHSLFRSRLMSMGRPVPAMDSMIAATAIAHSLTLVTRNVKDFMYIADVAPLKIENWFDEF